MIDGRKHLLHSLQVDAFLLLNQFVKFLMDSKSIYYRTFCPLFSAKSLIFFPFFHLNEAFWSHRLRKRIKKYWLIHAFEIFPAVVQYQSTFHTLSILLCKRTTVVRMKFFSEGTELRQTLIKNILFKFNRDLLKRTFIRIHSL